MLGYIQCSKHLQSGQLAPVSAVFHVGYGWNKKPEKGINPPRFVVVLSARHLFRCLPIKKLQRALLMKNTFIVNPNITSLDLENAIHSTFKKSKAILNCTLFAMNFAREEMELDQETLYYVLSAVDGCLDEMATLFLFSEARQP